MVAYSSLWLPIVLSAVFVFVASAILHMVLPLHRSDYKQLPDEGTVLAALRAANPRRGLYMFPFCDPKQRSSPAAKEKFSQGPVGMLAIVPNGMPPMPKLLLFWFIYTLIVSAWVGCLAAHTAILGPEAHHHVFHIVAATAFLAYGISQLVNSIWRGFPWGLMLKELMDGLIYAIITGLVFVWLWPH
ncbi:MAG TPA: hypothetical protein VN661_05905 [Candidatus Acidoferrales bacterium]|nr:hypothetical protein [Candidatus Acidoferrales bacterium]